MNSVEKGIEKGIEKGRAKAGRKAVVLLYETRFVANRDPTNAICEMIHPLSISK